MLECNRFAIQEHKKILSAVQSYDIRNADTGEIVGFAREDIGWLTQTLRWFMSKHLLPTRLEVREKPDDSLVFSLRRGWYIFRSRVEVRDSMDQLVGYFKSKFFTISGGFHVYDKDDKYFAHVQGRLFGFDYRFLTEDGKVELGRVSKRIGGPAGLAREVFFSADNYYLEVNPDLAEQPMAKMLLLAATLAVDLIYKSETTGTIDVDIE
ncbi:MAG TPA: phospholipid scramblase-related protein [Gemmata sp.]|nr:phospholipid scramblase-related protein [Gemmata sp.]